MIALFGLAVALYHAARWPGRVNHLRAESAAGVLFLIALFALGRSRIDARRGLFGVVIVGAVLQALVVGTPPISSDDAYRYGWDAKVQLAGIDPYRYAPDDPALDRLRTATLFPPGIVCPWKLRDGSCSRVNRPGVHTIYPPVAEGAFTLSRVASLGRTDGTVPMQVLGGLGALAVSLLLAGRARRDALAPWTVAVWAWCPVTVIEVGNNAHIDWLAALLSVAALMAVRDRRPAWAGALLGAAIATKLYPGVLLASLLRRRPLRVAGAAVGVVALSYVGHVAAVGAEVIGYLPGYLREENYLDGGRFRLLDILLPTAWLSAAGAVILLGVGLWALRRSDDVTPERTAVVVMGSALLVSTPTYAWYAVVLLALVALSRRLEWLPLVLLMTVAMMAGPGSLGPVSWPTLCYLVALGAALGPVVVRLLMRLVARRARSGITGGGEPRSARPPVRAGVGAGAGVTDRPTRLAPLRPGRRSAGGRRAGSDGREVP